MILNTALNHLCPTTVRIPARPYGNNYEYYYYGIPRPSTVAIGTQPSLAVRSTRGLAHPDLPVFRVVAVRIPFIARPRPTIRVGIPIIYAQYAHIYTHERTYEPVK
jgi:hypothetical protein